MKFSSLSKWLGTGLLAAGLAVLPLTLPAQAQDTTTETYVEPDGDVEEAETEDNFDWGWLGLLGLAGLAGLAKRSATRMYTAYGLTLLLMVPTS